MDPVWPDDEAHGLDGIPDALAVEHADEAADFGHRSIDARDRRVTWNAGIAAIVDSAMPPGGTLPLERHLAIYHPDDRAAVRERIEAALRWDDPALSHGYKGQARVVRPDGTERVVMICGAPARDRAGLFTGLRGVLVDVTEHARTRAALDEAAELLRATLESMDQV